MKSTSQGASALVSAILVAIAGATAACGGATSGGGASPEPARAVVAEPSASEDAGQGRPAPVDVDAGPSSPVGACGGLSLGGPVVTAANTWTDAPAATGGTIAPGTYDLTLDVFHLGARDDAPTPTSNQTGRAQTLTVTLGAFQTVTDDAKGVSRASGAHTEQGIHMELLASCPDGEPPSPFTFSATADELHLFRGAGCVEELVFTRRAGS